MEAIFIKDRGLAPCYPESGCDRSDGKHRAAGKCSEPHPLRREPEDENRTRHERDRSVQAAGSERFGHQHGACRGKSGAGAEGKAGVYLQ